MRPAELRPRRIGRHPRHARPSAASALDRRARRARRSPRPTISVLSVSTPDCVEREALEPLAGLSRAEVRACSASGANDPAALQAVHADADDHRRQRDRPDQDRRAAAGLAGDQSPSGRRRRPAAAARRRSATGPRPGARRGRRPAGRRARPSAIVAGDRRRGDRQVAAAGDLPLLAGVLELLGCRVVLCVRRAIALPERQRQRGAERQRPFEHRVGDRRDGRRSSTATSVRPTTRRIG